MRYLVVVLLLTLSLVSKELESTGVNPDAYVIQVATVKSKTTALTILSQFPNMNTYIAVVDDYIVLYVVNLESKEDGRKKLNIIHKKYKDAYIRKLSKLSVSRLIKIEDIEPEILSAQLIDEDVDVYEKKLTDAYEQKISEEIKERLEFEAQRVSLDDDELFHANREKGYTLLEAIVQSLNNNNKLKASMDKINQSKYQVDEQEAGHLPSIDLSGVAGYERRTSQSGDLDVNNTIEDVEMKYKKTEAYLTITENLWSGGKIEGRVSEQESKLQGALHEHRDKMESATIEIIKSYFDVVYAEIAVKVSQKNMQNYQKILNIVKIKEENGASTKGDVNFILANVDNAKTALINTQAKLSDAMAKYEYLMQDVNKNNMPFETGMIIPTHNLEDSLAYMSEHNAKILSQKAYIQASAYAMDAQEANYYPTIDFAVNAEKRNEFDVGIGTRDKVNAIVTLSYNLYAGGKDEAGYLRKLARNSELKHLLEDKKRKLVFDIKVIHRAVSSTSDSLELTRSEVIAARKVVESYWIAFKHGTQDLQALQLAQRNLNRSELDYITYKKNLIINDFKLKQDTGELLPYLRIINLKGREFAHND